MVALTAASHAAPHATGRARADEGQPLALTTDDGARLAATWYAAESASPHEVTLVVVAAAGVTMGFSARLGHFGLFKKPARAPCSTLLALAFDDQGCAR